MKTVAFIFARGGSKGLPGKNIKNFQGKPLIAHSIEFALESKTIDDVIISTDCPEIAKIAKEYGANVPFIRPDELSTDNSPEMEAWKHAVDFYRKDISDFDRFISLPVVSPLRVQSDLDEIWTQLKTSDFVLSVKESDANPYFNLIEQGDSGYNLCKPIGRTYRRQDSKKVYKVIPMYYACKPSAIDQYKSLLDGKIGIVEIPRDRAADIDTPQDFAYLEYLSSIKKDFNES